MRRSIKLLLGFSALSMTGFGAGSFIDRFFLPPPLAFTALSDLSQTSVVPGGILELKIEARRTTGKTCSGLVDREFHRVEQRDGKPYVVVVTIPNQTTAFLNPPQPILYSQFQVPTIIAPGDWMYQSRTTYTCSGWEWVFGPRQLWSPEVPVRIATK